MLSPVGKVLYLDNATVNKTKGSMARVRIQLDITKDRDLNMFGLVMMKKI